MNALTGFTTHECAACLQNRAHALGHDICVQCEADFDALKAIVQMRRRVTSGDVAELKRRHAELTRGLVAQ